MRIDGFIWLPNIIDKLAQKHHMDQDEAEKENNMALILSARDMDGKERRRHERK